MTRLGFGRVETREDAGTYWLVFYVCKDFMNNVCMAADWDLSAVVITGLSIMSF